MRNLIDASAWIEFFLGTEEGAKIGEFLREGIPITLDSTLAEINEWCIRSDHNFNEILLCLEEDSEIIKATRHDWIDAAKIKQSMRRHAKDIGLMDALLIAVAQSRKDRIVTCDSHFSKCQNAVVI